jgi:hypothetical protein
MLKKCCTLRIHMDRTAGIGHRNKDAAMPTGTPHTAQMMYRLGACQRAAKKASG